MRRSDGSFIADGDYDAGRYIQIVYTGSVWWSNIQPPAPQAGGEGDITAVLAGTGLSGGGIFWQCHAERVSNGSEHPRSCQLLRSCQVCSTPIRIPISVCQLDPSASSQPDYQRYAEVQRGWP